MPKLTWKSLQNISAICPAWFHLNTSPLSELITKIFNEEL